MAEWFPRLDDWMYSNERRRQRLREQYPDFRPPTSEQERAWRESHKDDDDVGQLEDQEVVEGRYYNPNGADVPRPRARRRTAGKTVHSVRYRGTKRDRKADPYWTWTPANVVSAVEENRLDTSVIPYATFLYQHIRRSERYKDKGQRITCGELGARLHRSERSVRRAIAAMVKAGELEVVSSGKHNRNGAIYRFRPRASGGEIEI